MRLTDEFYKEEIKDGYFVTSIKKQVWAVELDLLEQLSAICERHKIKYFAIGGTLLGAVRHKGFIPWDDDIDIGMLRQDYDRFLHVCEKELKAPYFLQTTMTDHCYRAHAQIRNSSTTGYAAIDETLNCNKGIFIDIFPLDGVADEPTLYRLQMLEMKFWNRLFMNYYYFDVMHPNPAVPMVLAHRAVVFCLDTIGLRRCYQHFDHVSARYSSGTTKKVGELSILFDDRRYQWKQDCFFETVLLPFEQGTIPVPKNYRYFLKRTFGDYMKFPENKTERALHGEMVFFPDRPFR